MLNRKIEIKPTATAVHHLFLAFSGGTRRCHQKS